MAHIIHIPDEAHWHTVRESHIGGSEIACLFYRWQFPDGSEKVCHLFEEVPADAVLVDCLSPYKTGYRLWQEKFGGLIPDSFADNERVDAGSFLEPALAAWAEKKWQWKLRKVRRYHQHEHVAGWGASLDYEVHGEGMPPVEFKNIDYSIFKREWLVEDDEIVLPPMQYLLQVQHQLGATGAACGWIVACVGGNKLLRGQIPRHEPTLAKIGEAVAAFWAAIAANTPPERVADYEAVSKAYASGDRAFGVDLTEREDIPVLCGRYQRLKKHLERMETHAENLKGRIAQAMGTATKAQATGYRLSWPVIERAEKEIPARIQKALTYRGGLTITKIEG